MACDRKYFSITWRIENYNFFNFSPGYGPFSPSFVIDSVKDTSWQLRIGANSAKMKGHFVFHIIRKALSPATDLGLDFEISFFNEDGSCVIYEDSYTHIYCIDQEIFECSIPHHQVYPKKGNEICPPKTLTIRCRMFKKNGSFSETGQCFVRSRFRLERTAFVAATESFSNLLPEEKRTLIIKSASTEDQLLSLKIYLGGHLCCKDNLWIEIIPVKENYKNFCICKLLLCDSEGMKIECGKNEFLFYGTEKQDWKFPLYFTKGYLMARNTQFLSNDTLTLKCEFAFSTGMEYERIEDSEFGNLAPVTENHPKLPCVSEDLTCLYEKGILCDVKLQTESETFNVHKCILSARSSVFKTMFTTHMREETNDCVIIEDLEADTVRRMVIFLYSDKLEDLDWEKAKSLYFAADKYNIIGLKHRCSSFLKTCLQSRNCCELLLLADRHQDGDLKKNVQKYIADNREEIFRSDQWTKLEKSNPELSIETFHAVYLGNYKN